MDSNELTLKHELVNTTATNGWFHIRSLAEKLLVSKERAALTEENETKIIALQRKAQAAREFWMELVDTITKSKTVGSPSDADFADVACE